MNLSTHGQGLPEVVESIHRQDRAITFDHRPFEGVRFAASRPGQQEKPDTGDLDGIGLCHLIEPVVVDRGRWKAATIEGHRHGLDKLILPVLRSLAVDKISYTDVTAWLDGLDIAGRSKDRATSVLSSLIRNAETLGLRPAGSNPSAGRRRHRSDFEARYLTVRGYRPLALALDQAAKADPVEVACIRFLMLTGARRGEALSLEWSMVQLDRATLPDSKTGPRTVLLGKAAMKLLQRRRRERGRTSSFVFPSPVDAAKPRRCILCVWRRICVEAGLADDIHLHDLRHTCASVAVGSGETLMMASQLLGHRNTVTTERYAHLADRFLLDAAERVASEILKLSDRA